MGAGVQLWNALRAGSSEGIDRGLSRRDRSSDLVNNGEEFSVRFIVERTWKGSKGPRITVRTATAGSVCGITSFEVAQRWLIFAGDDGMGGYHTGACSGDVAIQQPGDLPV